MRPFIAVLSLVSLFGGPGWAENWQHLDGVQIREELTDRRLEYENGAWQEFRASGATLYNAGADSWGYWRAEQGRYCSQWPPQDRWDCYDLEQAGDRFRFIDDFGNETLGRRLP